MGQVRQKKRRNFGKGNSSPSRENREDGAFLPVLLIRKSKKQGQFLTINSVRNSRKKKSHGRGWAVSVVMLARK